MVLSMKGTVSVAVAARYMGVHENTIRKWIKLSLLPAKRVGARGRFRIQTLDLLKLLKDDANVQVQEA